MKKIFTLITAIFGLLTTTTIAQVPNYVPTNGLLAWYPFTGNSNDVSGNANNGTNNGATLTTDRFGNANSAYSFNGTSNYIDVNDVASLRLNNTDYTISFWTYINAFSTGGGTAFIYKRSNGSQNGWGIGADQGTQDKLMLLASESTDPRGYSTSTLALSGWHNVTIVYTLTSQELKFYIDGVLDNTTTGVDNNYNPIGGMPSPNANCTSVMRFGQDTKNNSYWLDGKLDDIGLWNRALTQQEITDLYNGCQLTVNTQPNSQTININNNAQFTVGSSDPSATYQWQTDLGVGFQNLNNVGQYSGTANDTLSIANTTLSNNNQPFRCIISSGTCTDTSNVAILAVNNNVGINEFTQDNLFSVYPNPAKSQINVKADATLLGSVYTVYDNTGKVVLSGKINSENTVIELVNLSGGVYLLSVGENMKQTFKVIKE